MCTLYERIQSLCSSKGISPSKMCLELGLSKSTVSDLRSGRKKGVSTSTANKIANYFCVSVDYLLSGESDQKNIPATQMGSEDDVTKALYAFIQDSTPEERQELINIANYIISKRKEG